MTEKELMELKIEELENEYELMLESRNIHMVQASKRAKQVKELRERVAQTEQVLDACEQNNAQHIRRIMELETLCRDMWLELDISGDYAPRMKDLGLLEVADPTENELLMDTFFKDAQGKTPTEQLEALTEACRKQVD